MNKLLISLIGIVCFIVLVGAIQITNFSGYGNSENLTFTSDENISRNLTIPYNAEIVSATMNLSGYGNFENSFNDFFNDSYINQTIWINNSNSRGNLSEISNLKLHAFGGGLNAHGYAYITSLNYSKETLINFSLGIINNSQSMNTGLGNRFYQQVIEFCNESSAISSVMGHCSNAVRIYITGYDDANNVCYGDGCYNNGTIDFVYDLSLDNLTKYINGVAIENYSLSSITENFKIQLFVVSKQHATGATGFYSKWNLGNFSMNVVNYSTSPYIQINNTKIWNHTGELNSTNSPQKTTDFASILNTALNGGLCDCDGCVLSGTNCLIENIFHSDEAGILEYSAIDIQYTPAPFPTLESPSNNSYSPATKTFNCSATDEEGLSNLTFYFWNSTGNLNLSTTKSLTGTSNSTTYSMTFNSTDTYTWGCSAINNNSREWWADDNFTINVDIDNPIINSLSPSNNSWDNLKSNTTFYYTPSHSVDTIHTCKFYSNFTGTWLANQTDSSINTSNQNNFTLNLSGLADDDYEWTIWCNTTTTGNSAYSQSGNYTIKVDTTLPFILINSSISTTAGSQTISFTNNVSDTNLDSCKYSIFNSTGGIDGINENVSFTCGAETSATVTAFGTYNLTIYATDLALNENSSTDSFTTSPAEEGGGGGGAAIIIGAGVLEATNFSITTRNFKSNIDVSLAKDSVKPRVKDFIITNEGIDPINVEIFCSIENSTASSYIEGNLSICDFVELSNTTAIISAIEEDRFEGYFKILPPTNSKIGDEFFFNIFVVREIEDEKRFSKLSVSARLTKLGIIGKWSYIPGQLDKPKEERKSYPVWVLSLLLSSLLFILIIFIAVKRKLIFAGFFTGLIAFMISLVMLIIYL